MVVDLGMGIETVDHMEQAGQLRSLDGQVCGTATTEDSDIDECFQRRCGLHRVDFDTRRQQCE